MVVLDKTHDLNADATFDFWIGKLQAEAMIDTFVKARGLVAAATFDMLISRRASSTFNMYVSEARGTYRGIMSPTERDALPALQPHDAVHVVREDQPTQTEMWTGTQWITGDKVIPPEAGQKRSLIAPTLEGYFAEMGDPDTPFRYSDGVSNLFAVTDDGAVQATQFDFGEGSTLDAADSITLRETVPFATPTQVQARQDYGLAIATKSVAYGTPTVAGNLLVFMAEAAANVTVVTPPVGFTLVRALAGAGASVFMYYKQNCGAAEASPSITFSAATDIIVSVFEYSGIATSSALDVSNIETTSSYASSEHVANVGTSNIVPTTGPVSLLLAMVGRSGVQAPFSAGWTAPVNELHGTAGLIIGQAFASAPGQFQFRSNGEDYVARGIFAAFTAKAIGIPTPSAHKIAIYAEALAGVPKPKYINPLGVAYLLDSGARTSGFALGAEPLVANTTVKTQVFSYSIPANKAQPGDILTIELFGNTSHKASSGTFLSEMTVNGLVLSKTLASEVNAHSDDPWRIRLTAQITEIGNPGTIQWLLAWTSYFKASTTDTSFRDAMWNGIATPDTTIDVPMLDFSVKWGSGGVANVFFMNGATVHMARRG
jgi:hypothetical protein